MNHTDSTQLEESRGRGDGDGVARTAPGSGAQGEAVPDPEVEAKAKRRQFSASYKARILEEIDRSPGQTGAILRREALYSSHVTTWRKQRREGTLRALGAKRGRKVKSAAEVENEQLRRRMAKLERELEKAQLIIAAQKKLAAVLGTDLPRIAEGGDESE